MYLSLFQLSIAGVDKYRVFQIQLSISAQRIGSVSKINAIISLKKKGIGIQVDTTALLN